MARFLIAATSVTGHVVPLLAIAHHLVGLGHEVVVHTASLFRQRAEAIGATFVPFHPTIDLDYRRVDEYFPERRSIPVGMGQTRFTLKRFFADPIPYQAAGIRDILRDFPADAILVDTMFCGTFPLLLGPQEARPSIIGLGITALSLTSVDTAFFGTALPPSSTPQGRARNIAMHKNMQLIYSGVQQDFNNVLAKLGCPPLPAFIADCWSTLPDLYLQLTSESFEYPRSDLADTIRFVGPLLAPPTTDFTPPPWWSDLDDGRPVVLVTQGTLANTDFTQLIGPSLTALAAEKVIVVVTTGGPPIETIPVPLRANARATTFVPFDQILPKVTVFITNGGYGSVNHALSLGVPLVIAGDSEEKPEIAARVAWTGAGINLGTGRPSPSQIRDAVISILANSSYRQRARALRDDFARHDARREIAQILEDLVAKGTLRPRSNGCACMPEQGRDG